MRIEEGHIQGESHLMPGNAVKFALFENSGAERRSNDARQTEVGRLEFAILKHAFPENRSLENAVFEFTVKELNTFKNLIAPVTRDFFSVANSVFSRDLSHWDVLKSSANVNRRP